MHIINICLSLAFLTLLNKTRAKLYRKLGKAFLFVRFWGRLFQKKSHVGSMLTKQKLAASVILVFFYISPLSLLGLKS